MRSSLPRVGSSDLLAFTNANATQIKCMIPSTVVYIFALMYMGRISKQHPGRTLCTHELMKMFYMSCSESVVASKIMNNQTVVSSIL